MGGLRGRAAQRRRGRQNAGCPGLARPGLTARVPGRVCAMVGAAVLIPAPERGLVLQNASLSSSDSRPILERTRLHALTNSSARALEGRSPCEGMPGDVTVPDWIRSHQLDQNLDNTLQPHTEAFKHMLRIYGFTHIRTCVYIDANVSTHTCTYT